MEVEIVYIKNITLGVRRQNSMRLELYTDNAFPVSVLLNTYSPLHRHTHVQPAGQTCTPGSLALHQS